MDKPLDATSVAGVVRRFGQQVELKITSDGKGWVSLEVWEGGLAVGPVMAFPGEPLVLQLVMHLMQPEEAVDWLRDMASLVDEGIREVRSK